MVKALNVGSDRIIRGEENGRESISEFKEGR